MRTWLAALAVVVAGAGLVACGGPGASAADGPDRGRFGYRVGSDGNRETMTVRPITDSTRYLVYPAVVDSVAVRTAGRAGTGDAVAVEVLVQGALPDACAELTEVTQSREGRFVAVDLFMRQPRETVCAAVVRPFRFYVVLDGSFEAGSYTLRVNGSPMPFQVLPVVEAEG